LGFFSFGADLPTFALGVTPTDFTIFGAGSLRVIFAMIGIY